MAALKLTNLLAYKNYFREIAATHPAIQGFKWGEKDVLRNDNRSDMPEAFLWAMPYEEGTYGDNLSDNIVKRKIARLSYLQVRNSDMFADEEEQYEYCESVVEDIVAKLLHDKRGEPVNGEWVMIATDVNSFKISPVEVKLGATPYLGFDLQITFMDNTNLAYNPQLWQ